MLTSFPPILPERPQILILGSMPGKESLRKQQYYAHKQNQFWRMLYRILEIDFIEEYEEKKKCLLDNQIALWDVLKHCERETSLDSDIKDEIPNNIAELIEEHTTLQAVCFNGQKSLQVFKRFIGFKHSVEYLTLPSTSPAHASKSFEEKFDIWKQLKNYIV